MLLSISLPTAAASALCQCWSCGAFSETKGIGCAPPLPLPILPRLQEAEQSKSLTAEKTLVLGTFTMPSFNYQMLKYQNIILDRVLSIFGIKNYLQPDTRDKYCVKWSFQNQSSWYIGVDSVGGDILGAMSCHSGAVTVLVGWAMVSRLLHLSRISRR